MVKVVKKVMSNVLSRVSSFLTSKGYGSASPVLLVNNDPELIQAMKLDMANHDAGLLATRLLEMEKAIFHLAGRLKDNFEEQKDTKELVVGVATTLDEMLHGMEASYEEETEETVLEDAWEGKKGSSLN